MISASSGLTSMIATMCRPLLWTVGVVGAAIGAADAFVTGAAASGAGSKVKMTLRFWMIILVVTSLPPSSVMGSLGLLVLARASWFTYTDRMILTRSPGTMSVPTPLI